MPKHHSHDPSHRPREGIWTKLSTDEGWRMVTANLPDKGKPWATAAIIPNKTMATHSYKQTRPLWNKEHKNLYLPYGFVSWKMKEDSNQKHSQDYYCSSRRSIFILAFVRVNRNRRASWLANIFQTSVIALCVFSGVFSLVGRKEEMGEVKKLQRSVTIGFQLVKWDCAV